MKVLKIKVGSFWNGEKSIDVYQEAWEKESKDGKKKYYEIRTPVFVQTIERKEETKEEGA